MKKKTKLGQELIQGLEEAISYERGEITLRTHSLEIPDEPPHWTREMIVELRVKKLKVSQPIMAAYLGVSAAALRAWEQGVKSPTGSARRVLQLLAANPKSVISLMFQSVQGAGRKDSPKRSAA